MVLKNPLAQPIMARVIITRNGNFEPVLEFRRRVGKGVDKSYEALRLVLMTAVHNATVTDDADKHDLLFRPEFSDSFKSLGSCLQKGIIEYKKGKYVFALD